MGNRKIFIGAAWPYANGSLHLGHAAALLGSDVLARYFRLNGDSVLFVSGSDCHGTPIALQAEKLGIKPEEIANKYHQEFSKTLIQGLNFSFDYYSETTKESHQKLVQDIFLDLWKKKLIYTKTEELAYCDTCQRFLPDRYIEGECPHCHFGSARGDQCDNCGNLIDPKTLIKPQCQICHQAPVWKESEHFFLKISAFNDDLKQWVENSQGWRLNAKSFSLELLKQGFRDRAISRDTDWEYQFLYPAMNLREFMFGLRLFVVIYQLAKIGIQKLGKIFGKMIPLVIIMFMVKIIFLFILSFGRVFY